MSNDNNENIITDFSDGKNFRRKENYNNKKPILVCFNGIAFRWKGIIEVLLKLMKKWKGQDFDEEILKIRTSAGILFSKSSNEIFNHKLIESIYIEKVYESASNNYIIELCLAILEQFRYKQELKMLFADEKHPYNVDIKSLEPITWIEPWELYKSEYDNSVLHASYELSNKLPEAGRDITIICYKDGEIIDASLKDDHYKKREIRFSKDIKKNYGITRDSLKKFEVRFGLLYPDIRNYLIILDIQEIVTEQKKVERLTEASTILKEKNKVEDIDIGEGVKMDKNEEISEDIKELQRLREIVGPEEFANIVNNVHDVAKQKIDNDERDAEILRIAEEQRIKDDEEKTRLLKKEEERRSKIDAKLVNMSANSKRAMRAVNILYEGVPRIAKTTRAKKCGVEIIDTFVDTETDNKFVEFYNRGYIEIVTFNPAADSNKTIEGMTIYIEKEGVATDKTQYISLAGLMKDKSKLAIGLAIGLDEGYLKKKDTSYVNVLVAYEVKIKKMTREQVKELFKYAPKVVIILDELNRGNVPELLGDLVTVIERNKRLGEYDETPTKLLRSGDRFVMPPNLYILATRNNAVHVDVSHIDEGILMRFLPEGMVPDFNEVQNYLRDNEKAIQDAGVYNIISMSIDAIPILNNRISDNGDLGRGKVIGHTYLFDIKDPLDADIEWRKILKLVTENCSEDYDEVNKILFDGKDKKWVNRRDGIHGIDNLGDLEEFIGDIIRSQKVSKKI